MVSNAAISSRRRKMLREPESEESRRSLVSFNGFNGFSAVVSPEAKN